MTPTHIHAALCATSAYRPGEAVNPRALPSSTSYARIWGPYDSPELNQPAVLPWSGHPAVCSAPPNKKTCSYHLQEPLKGCSVGSGPTFLLAPPRCFTAPGPIIWFFNDQPLHKSALEGGHVELAAGLVGEQHALVELHALALLPQGRKQRRRQVPARRSLVISAVIMDLL